MNLILTLEHLKKDILLAPIIHSVPPPEINPNAQVYMDMLDSIVSQQLSVKVATIIFNRFRGLFPDGHPAPHQIIEKDIALLRSVGLSNQKANYIQNFAHFAIEHDLENYKWDHLTDDEIIDFLTQIKGVGKWTVQMILIFSLHRPDVFPVDDLGIQQGMAKCYGLHGTGKELKLKMTQIAEQWKPYRSVASRYIWKWKDLNKD